MPPGAPGSRSPVSSKSAQAQAVLEVAKNRFATTQSLLVTTQENYTKSSALLVELQNKRGDIQATLTKLTATTISLVRMIKILHS